MLSADAKALNQRLVPLRTAAAQIIQQPAAARHHLQQTPARVVVLFVRLEVLRQLGDAPAENCHLDLWRACVRLMDPKLRDYSLLRFTRQRHSEIDTPRLFLIDWFKFRITQTHLETFRLPATPGPASRTANP